MLKTKYKRYASVCLTVNFICFESNFKSLCRIIRYIMAILDGQNVVFAFWLNFRWRMEWYRFKHVGLRHYLANGLLLNYTNFNLVVLLENGLFNSSGPQADLCACFKHGVWCVHCFICICICVSLEVIRSLFYCEQKSVNSHFWK